MSRKPSRLYITAALIGVVMAMGGLSSASHAQVTPDTSAQGNLGTVVTAGPNFDITGGTRPGNGTNLFHGFESFSLGASEIANFINDSGLPTSNILSRVTGGNPSNIFGTIQTTGFPGANLFLINPAGILFGPTAQLNVEGSFHATTADYVKLGNDGVFYADPSQASVLTSAPPSAFGFLTSNPASIEVQTGGLDDTFYPTALLQVPEGQTLSLVGGNAPGSDIPGVAIGALDGSTPGYVLAPAGRVNLVSVASAGEAAFDGTGFNVDSFPQLGTILIGRGPDADIFNEGASIVDGKEIFIRGGRLEINNGVVVPGGFANELSFVGLSPLPDGGEVNIKVTDDVTITGTDLDGLTLAPPGIFVYAGDFFDISPESKVPDVNITAGSVSISGLAGIQSNRNAPGAPGDVVIDADAVNVASGGSIILFNAFEGSGGNLTINANDVNISGDGSASAVGVEGLANQGVVHLAYLFPYTDPELITADSGSVTINATDGLTVSGLGQITTENRVFGRAGSVTINAGDVLVAGTGDPASAVIATQSAFTGDADNVVINAARTLAIKDGGRIASGTIGMGNAGNVDVTAGESVTLSGANARVEGVTVQNDNALNDLFNEVFLESFDDIRAEMGDPNASLSEVLAYMRDVRQVVLIPDLDLTPGDGGTISVTTPVLTLNADTRLETSTSWDGNAGQIHANVGSLFLNDGALINSSSGFQFLVSGQIGIGPGTAGEINLAASDTISISGHSPTSGEGSSVSTTTFGDGAGGSIVLTADNVDLANGGIISAQTGGLLGDQFFAGTGNAGTVTMNATGPLTISGTDSTVSTTTTGDGAGGSIALTGEDDPDSQWR